MSRPASPSCDEPTGLSLNRSTARPSRPLSEARFRRLLAGIRTLLQPIVSVSDGATHGYEALTRGPRGPLESPVELFDAACRAGQLVPLEQATRASALKAKVRLLPPRTRLFLNIDPRVMVDPHFRRGMTRALMDPLGIAPDEVVIEITERAAVSDLAIFRRSVDHYRAQGFAIAVDDAGAGYASLETILELAPEYIKLDRALVGGLHRDRRRRALVRAMAGYARDVGALVVAEGIEEQGELEAVAACGVPLAQGYLLGRPERRPNPGRFVMSPP